MKKIMFNDRYGLTEAVLKGRKTMTRRVIPELLNVEDPDISEWGLTDGGKAMITLYEGGRPTTDIFPMYQPGEVVAVAQSYQTIEKEIRSLGLPLDLKENIAKHKGYTNKMFVKASYMPHQIRITDIKIERLQDISNEDCLQEGILSGYKIRCNLNDQEVYEDNYIINYCDKDFGSPLNAFAALIDKVSGKGTWERNPWVFAYSFKLLK